MISLLRWAVDMHLLGHTPSSSRAKTNPQNTSRISGNGGRDVCAGSTSGGGVEEVQGGSERAGHEEGYGVNGESVNIVQEIVRHARRCLLLPQLCEAVASEGKPRRQHRLPSTAPATPTDSSARVEDEKENEDEGWRGAEKRKGFMFSAHVVAEVKQAALALTRAVNGGGGLRGARTPRNRKRRGRGWKQPRRRRRRSGREGGVLDDCTE